MVMPVTDHLVICLTELARAGQARSLHMTTPSLSLVHRATCHNNSICSECSEPRALLLSCSVSRASLRTSPPARGALARLTTRPHRAGARVSGIC